MLLNAQLGSNRGQIGVIPGQIWIMPLIWYDSLEEPAGCPVAQTLSCHGKDNALYNMGTTLPSCRASSWITIHMCRGFLFHYLSYFMMECNFISNWGIYFKVNEHSKSSQTNSMMLPPCSITQNQLAWDGGICCWILRFGLARRWYSVRLHCSRTVGGICCKLEVYVVLYPALRPWTEWNLSFYVQRMNVSIKKCKSRYTWIGSSDYPLAVWELLLLLNFSSELVLSVLFGDNWPWCPRANTIRTNEARGPQRIPGGLPRCPLVLPCPNVLGNGKLLQAIPWHDYQGYRSYTNGCLW